MLKVILAAALAMTVQPGGSSFSVEVATECAGQSACEGARWSDFYNAWVRRESEAAARSRFAEIATAIDRNARKVLCLDDTGKPTCEQSKAQKRWQLDELVALASGVAIAESGLREDVQVGRGASKKPSADGGRGRGPGMEACLMQIHPTVTSSAPLLGRDTEALDRCFSQGIGMLVHARQWCAGNAPHTDWMFATVSLYGTGKSCSSPNQGKTHVRVRYARQILAGMRKAAKS